MEPKKRRRTGRGFGRACEMPLPNGNPCPGKAVTSWRQLRLCEVHAPGIAGRAPDDQAALVAALDKYRLSIGRYRSGYYRRRNAAGREAGEVRNGVEALDREYLAAMERDQ